MQSRKPVTILLINAIAILSEDRFLARSTFYILLRSTLGRKRIQHLPPPLLNQGRTHQEASSGREANQYIHIHSWLLRQILRPSLWTVRARPERKRQNHQLNSKCPDDHEGCVSLILPPLSFPQERGCRHFIQLFLLRADAMTTSYITLPQCL